jgi:hypothetical protein
MYLRYTGTTHCSAPAPCSRQGPQLEQVCPHPGAEPLPDDVSEILGALSCLPAVKDVDTTPLPPAGDWCVNIPLWGNPLLPTGTAAAGAGADGGNIGVADSNFVPEEDAPAAAGPGTGLRPGLENRHTRLAACTALRTVGDAGRALMAAPAPRC